METDLTENQRKRRVYRPVVALAIMSMLICGLAFPLVVTGIAQLVLPYQANGSLVQLRGHAIGSTLIDNGFTLPVFFHARNETNPLSTSASGVDPDITLQDALNQTQRISTATGGRVSMTYLTGLVMSHQQWTLGIAGDPYVNVLSLNLALISDNPAVYSSYG